MDNVIGYLLLGYDNGTFMYTADDAVEKCLTCGYRINFFSTNPNYKFDKIFKPHYMDFAVTPQTDLSTTSDGQIIVSRDFKDACSRYRIEGAIFAGFPEDPAHSHLVVRQEIRFDFCGRDTMLENFCPMCGNYKSVIGATPALFKENSLSDGFYRSDILFGTGDEKSPLVVVGHNTKSVLEALNLTGFDFEPVYGPCY